MDGTDKTVCKIARKKTVAELFLTSLKFFTIITAIILTTTIVVKYFLDVNPLYLLFVIGVLCSTIATYYKIRMALNPDFKPNCNCYDNQSFMAETMNGVLTVLEHKRAKLLFNIPNSVYGIVFYGFMIVALYWDWRLMIKYLNIFSVIGSCVLWYIMITEVKNICALCTTIHAVNFLTYYYMF